MKEISLTRGLKCIVDDADYDRLVGMRWHATAFSDGRSNYARRIETHNGREGAVYLHRYILRVPRGVRIRFKNGNGLDCRRSNLLFPI